MEPSERYRVEALAKGLRVLRCFTEETPNLRVSDLATATGIPLATTFRLVATLELEGFLRKMPDGHYRPTARVLTLGHAALGGMGIIEIATPHLEALAREVHETVNLGVLHADYVIYLVRLRNTDLVTANLQVGSRLPAVSTSMGKALLAGRTVPELRKMLTARSFEFRGGKNAIRSVPALVPELTKIVRQGYALQDEEVADGLRSIAVPVQNRRGTTVAAVNIAASALRHSTKELVRDYLDPLRLTASTIGRQLDDRTI